jgi:ABC-2 type transport system ATP-binding protein
MSDRPQPGRPIRDGLATTAPHQRWAIEARGLGRAFGRSWAVAGLDLRVPASRIYGLIGPNGAGKTTTLRLLAGLLEPSAGEIRILGRPSTGLRQNDRVSHALGYMPDFFGVYEDMPAWEYLDFYARCYGLDRARRRRLVDDLLDLVRLADRRDDPVAELSRGMQQRLCLAHALVHDPPILLLDEPASGLDPRARRDLHGLLLELRARGKTILISSHNLSELADLCDEVGIMSRGRLLASGSLPELLGGEGGWRELEQLFLDLTDEESSGPTIAGTPPPRPAQSEEPA